VLRKLRAAGAADDETLAAALGREVGARWVVLGGVQRVGETVRLTARLTEVASGGVVASAKADGTLATIFELQDRLVRELTAGVVPRVTEGPGDEETRIVAAYEAYSKGVINARASTRESLERAILFFERAIAIDPSYARAHQQLGTAYDLKAMSLSMSDFFDKAILSFRRAIELRPSFSEAWREMGATLLSLGRDDEAMEAIKRALALDPSNPGAHASLGRTFFIGKGMWKESIEEYERALALNPQAGWYWLQLAHVAIFARDFPKAAHAARRAIQLQEEFLSGKEGVLSVGGYLRLGQIASLEGRYGDAVAEFDRERDFLIRVDHALRERTTIELRVRDAGARCKLGDLERAHAEARAALEGFDARLTLGADEPFSRYYAAIALALLGEKEKAIEFLEAAAAKRRRFTVARAVLEPDFEPLREEPRFKALVAGA
ncbi:MAG TPA: tetratricopeptide repeat protein, partial [Thermoanaerobaculia bacterium]|nr:tetratricopeptide repeat protein [Thermoanaerobaculia bacterium]